MVICSYEGSVASALGHEMAQRFGDDGVSSTPLNAALG